jgi:ABC-2 type transport system permease protein
MAVSPNARTFKWATWLGWQLESNWADPYLFLIYSIVKPIAGTLILVFMYQIIASINNTTDMALFAYMYVGNAMFMYCAQVLFGITWVIHDDREHYQTLKYIYISPSNYYVYILGRAVSKIVVTTFGVIITLLFGIYALQIPITLLGINWLYLALGMGLGLACVISFGLALAGISFLTAKHDQGMNEGIAGIFYLFCGVIFPISILPSWSTSFAMSLPITYWMYVMRVALLGADSGAVGLDGALAGYDVTMGFVVLAISTAVFFLFSIGIFRLGDYLARKKGLIDMTTAY